MMQTERRLNIRKPLDRLAYIGLPFNNGGIVLDVSEGGVGFHAIAPVEVDGPIHFRFAVDSSRRIKAVGELAWKDETGKTGGLRFTELPDGVREYIREWSGQKQAAIMDVPAANPESPAEDSLRNEAYPAPASDVSAADSTAPTADAFGGEIEPAQVAQIAPLDNSGWDPSWEVSAAEPEIEAETARVDSNKLPLLYNSKPPVYSAPSYELSMFSAAAESEARARAGEPRGPFPARHPIAALVLTIFLASVVASGIFAYVSTSQAGDVIYYLGEKVWEGIRPGPAPKTPAPQATSPEDSSKSSRR
jgi:PilZ domain